MEKFLVGVVIGLCIGFGLMDLSLTKFPVGSSPYMQDQIDAATGVFDSVNEYIFANWNLPSADAHRNDDLVESVYMQDVISILSDPMEVGLEKIKKIPP